MLDTRPPLPVQKLLDIHIFSILLTSFISNRTGAYFSPASFKILFAVPVGISLLPCLGIRISFPVRLPCHFYALLYPSPSARIPDFRRSVSSSLACFFISSSGVFSLWDSLTNPSIPKHTKPAIFFGEYLSCSLFFTCSV